VPLDQRLANQVAPKIVPYLRGTVTDAAGPLPGQVLIPALYSLIGEVQTPRSRALVLDRAGRALGSASCDWSLPSLTPAGTCAPALTGAPVNLNTPNVQKSIQGALAGGGPTVTRAGLPDYSSATLVLPVRDDSGVVLGTLIVIFDTPVSLRVPLTTGDSWGALGNLFGAFMNRIQPAGLAFLLLATVLGTLTGVLISRNLTARLRRITRAADAWSAGDFSVAVADPARDELGQLSRDLDRMAGQIQTLLTSRQELAVVEERNRLARDLHDSVKQQIFAEALLVRAARRLLDRDPVAAAGHLAEAEALAGQAQQELVALISALRPAALADKGLAPVLEEYAADWARRSGIAAEVRVAGARATPLDVEDALFRVAQEALANVARHSGARAVTLRLSWAPSELCLSVHDDGHGFDPARPAAGRGLVHMRERVESLGGRLTVASRPGGTCLEACAPAPPQPALAPRAAP